MSDSLQNNQQGEMLRRDYEEIKSHKLRRDVRLAEESKLRNGVIDIHRLVERITDESTAAQSQIIHNIELLKMRVGLHGIFVC